MKFKKMNYSENHIYVFFLLKSYIFQNSFFNPTRLIL